MKIKITIKYLLLNIIWIRETKNYFNIQVIYDGILQLAIFENK